MKAGDAIRINARLQEARTGKIVTAERVEGTGEASVFALVDELTRRFRTSMIARRDRRFGHRETAGRGRASRRSGSGPNG